MARRGFLSRIVSRVKEALTPSPERRERKRAAKAAKRERKILRKTAKKLGITIPPKPENSPSDLSVADRVARYKAMNPARRRVLRPQDEESMFWRLYDGMGE